MDRAIISALAAILGSLVGGGATIATAWLTQRAQGRRASIDAEVRKREALYVEFITEGSKILVAGFGQTADDLLGFHALYAILNRIRLVSSDEVVAAADHATTHILEPYFDTNVSREDLRELALKRPSDPLKEFSETCRHEIHRLQRGG